MKKLALLVLSVLLLASAVFAAPMSYSMVGGLNYGAGNYGGAKMGLGFNLGGKAYLPLDAQSSVSCGLSFTMINQQGSMGGTDFDLSSQWISIPVLYNYTLNKDWTLYGGLYYGMILNSYFKAAGVSASSTSMFGNDYGITLGGKYNLAKNQGINVDLTLGLANPSDRASGKSSTVLYSVSYEYGF